MKITDSPYDGFADRQQTLQAQMRAVLWASFSAASLAQSGEVFLTFAFALLAIGECCATTDKRAIRLYGLALLGLGRIVAWIAVNPSLSDPLITLGVLGWAIADVSYMVGRHQASMIGLGRNAAYAVAGALLLLGIA